VACPRRGRVNEKNWMDHNMMSHCPSLHWYPPQDAVPPMLLGYAPGYAPRSTEVHQYQVHLQSRENGLASVSCWSPPITCGVASGKTIACTCASTAPVTCASAVPVTCASAVPVTCGSAITITCACTSTATSI